ncbi:MAG: hypothetical protein FWG64_07185, partial [Firmicutes bacterium]|nr:hypothetical protein [Bacillota bacterium]
YDIFAGGLAMTAEAAICNVPTISNVYDKRILPILEYMFSLEYRHIDILVDLQTFYEIRNKPHKNGKEHLILMCNSWGYTSREYIYAKETAEIKHNLAMDILRNHASPQNYKQTATYKQAACLSPACRTGRGRQVEKMQRLENETIQGSQWENGQIKQVTFHRCQFSVEQLQRLQQLERVQQLQCLQQVEQVQNSMQLQNLLVGAGKTQFSQLDFADVKITAENAVIYCDPPYYGYMNSKYDGYIEETAFDWARFLDWLDVVKRLDNVQAVYLSHYGNPFLDRLFGEPCLDCGCGSLLQRGGNRRDSLTREMVYRVK